MADMPNSPMVDLSSIRTSNEFGDALTSVRLHAGLSVRELKRQVDIPLATLGGYFSGRHLPRDANVLRKILRTCGVAEDDQLSSWSSA
jgi:predicted transcriptional regulator